MARGADLFVVCKNCGSEVSPYVTECPYCGQRVRKRAPKIERTPAGGAREPRAGRRGRGRTATARRPRLGRLRSGEIPGLSSGALTKPWATITLVVGGVGDAATDILHRVHGRWTNASVGTAGEECVMPPVDRRNLGLAGYPCHR